MVAQSLRGLIQAWAGIPGGVREISTCAQGVDTDVTGTDGGKSGVGGYVGQELHLMRDWPET